MIPTRFHRDGTVTYATSNGQRVRCAPHQAEQACAAARAGQHGGARKGAGAPVTVGATVRVSLRITPAQEAALQALGHENISEGVRAAIDAYTRALVGA